MKIELGKINVDWLINVVRFTHIHHYKACLWKFVKWGEVRYNKAKMYSKFAIKRATTRARVR